MTDVLVLGMAAVDFVLSVPAFPTEPAKYRADKALITGGGPAANAAVAIVRLGGSARLLARLGGDRLGELVLSELAAEGVATDLIHLAHGGRSAFSSVLVDAVGERQIVNFRGDGLSQDTGWIARAPRAAAVLVDTRWPEGAATALDLARDWNVPGIVDGEAPIPEDLLQKASHLALSRQGLRSLIDNEDLPSALKSLAAHIPGWACVTDGAEGVWHTAAGGIAHVPAFDLPEFGLPVQDTLAAGDVWHGAFALALAGGAPEPAAIRFANAAAALKCARPGGRAAFPDRATVDAFLKETT